MRNKPITKKTNARNYIFGLLFILFVIVLLISLALASGKLEKSEQSGKSGKFVGKIDSRVAGILAKQGKAKVIVLMKDAKNEAENKRRLLAAYGKIGKSQGKTGTGANPGSDKITRQFSSFNGFSASLTESELTNLENDGNVEKIYYDYPVRAFLQNSASLINATLSWSLQSYGINLTGKGQTICIIDSGINYTHPDLGGCTPRNTTANGTETAYINESAHPYANGIGADSYSVLYNITMEGFANIAVHFVNISTEEGFDRVRILDGSQNLVKYYYGDFNDIWSPSVAGPTIYVGIYADSSVTDYGFYIDKVLNGTTNITFNWNSCSKIAGGYDFLNYDEDPFDNNGHGTHVAGIAAANGSINGVAPEARLAALKVLNADGEGYSSDIISAIEWCTGNSSAYNISAISMSLGGAVNYSSYCDSDDPLTAAAINAAVAKNISIVVAAGNSRNYTAISSPACMQNATPVAWSGNDDAINAQSNRNSLVQLAAPGTSINSTYLSSLSATGYSQLSGTSMSTPHVAGAIAIINQYLAIAGKPKSPSQAESLLNETGKQIYDSSSGLNFSRINLYNALMSIEPAVTFNAPTEASGASARRTSIPINATAIDINLANITVSLFNSSRALVNSSNSTANSTANSLFVNFTGLSEGIYYFNASACDILNKCSASETRNFSADFTALNITVLSPLNKSWHNALRFNVTFGEAASSCWFSLNHSANQSMLNLSSTVFYYINASASETSSNSNNNVTFYCNDTAGNLNSTFLLYFGIDKTAPAIIGLSPADSNSTTATSVTFYYTPSDNHLASCSLIFDSAVSETSASVTNNAQNSFTKSSISAGSHTWMINCTDEAGNIGSSSSRTITVTSPAGSTDTGGSSSTRTVADKASVTIPVVKSGGASSSSSSSSSEASPKIYSPTKEQLENEIGYTQSLSKGEKITFYLIKEAKAEMQLGIGKNQTSQTTDLLNETHAITLDSVQNDSVNITIESEPIKLVLNIGDEKKINLTSPDYYDLYIKLNSIANQSANLTVRIIHEPVSGWQRLKASFSEIGSIVKEGFVKCYGNAKKFAAKNYIWILAGLGVFILLIVNDVIKYRLMKKRQKAIKTPEFSRYESYHKINGR